MKVKRKEEKMKKELKIHVTSIFFVVIIPMILSAVSAEVSIQATYVSLGIAVYMFVSCRYFAEKTDLSYRIMWNSVMYVIVTMYALFGEMQWQYFFLDFVMAFLGVRLGNLKRKIQLAKDEQSIKKEEN